LPIKLFIEGIDDTEESKPEEVKEVLANYGIDPEELVKEGMQFIRSLEKKERVKIAQENTDEAISSSSVSFNVLVAGRRQV